MTSDRIERRLPEILTELSVPRVPDYLDDILSRTARTRQRPGWTLLERWLPMDFAVEPVRAGRLPWRTIGAVALLLLALASAVLYIGTRPPRRAPLFGPAPNGSIIYSRDGDIYAADADATHERLLIGGDTSDATVYWSLSGGTFFFGRVLPGGTAVMAADADGRNVRQVSSTLIRGWNAVSVSPDDQHLAVINVDERPSTLGLHALAGNGGYRELDLGQNVPAKYVAWRPPGDEIIFLGHPDGVETDLGLYAVRPDGTGLSSLALRHNESVGSVAAQLSFQDMVLSDDGRVAGYWNWEPGVVAGRTCSVHLIDLATGMDRRMTFDPTDACETRPAFLSDGRVIVERQDGNGFAQLLVAPSDASASGTLIGPRFPIFSRAAWVLSPDRERVLFVSQSGASQFISVASGGAEDAPIRLPIDLSWQRLTRPAMVEMIRSSDDVMK